MKVAVLGATGYVGGRLVPALLERGYQVKACGRSLKKLLSRPWANHSNVELCEVDVLNDSSLSHVFSGVQCVYYLIHSMNPHSKNFVNDDRRAAERTSQLAHQAGVKRIIYVGGLGEDSPGLSKHLRSRSEVGCILQQGPVPVTIFRAAMIIGSGSASFEILRYLVERLPVMITPKWVRTLNQPIAIRNVIYYLAECLTVYETVGKTFDIGGPDILTYEELMRIYAEEAKLPRRWIVPVPVLTPRLSSLWIHLVTPVPAYIARPLAEGLSNEVVCQDQEIRQFIPQELLSCREAIALALKRFWSQEVLTSWTDAGLLPPDATLIKGDPKWAGGTELIDDRKLIVRASADDVWGVIRRIGGQTGWYHADWLWALRGWMDKMVGGVGLRRGRRHPVDIAEGDSLDFWRVLEVKPGQSLLLVAEMRLPGAALLEFEIKPLDGQQVQLRQIARFYPKGLWGICYWYSITFLHAYVFGGMIRSIQNRAEKKVDNSYGTK